MSLLLKALQNAAKDREASAPAGNTATAAENRAGESAELTLEPVEQSQRTAPPSRSPSAQTDDLSDRAPAPSPQQAQSVLRAGAPRAAAVRSPGVMDWVARRPLVAFSTAAGSFAIGYGIYLYIQITNPGMFVARPAAPPASPPVAAAPTPPAPLPPQPQVMAPPPPPAQMPPDLAPTAGATAASPAVATGQAPVPPSTPPVTASRPVPASPAPQPPSPQVAAPAPAIPAPPGSPPAPQRIEATAGLGGPIPRGPAAAATPREPVPAARPRAVARSAAPATVAAKESPETSASAGGQVVAVDAGLAAAYQALEKGRLDDAERMYRQVLASDPRSTDAMLGLASTLTQRNRADAATQLYMRVLEQDPRNAYAQAGLLNIGGRSDPAAAEARLKQLIAREPSAFLYFSLGNLYSEQRQWAAAQSAYFQAFNLAPDNPDYAFNLAVGLEHLSQPKLALDYYRRAVALAQARGNAQFAMLPVQTRIRSLEAALSELP